MWFFLSVLCAILAAYGFRGRVSSSYQPYRIFYLMLWILAIGVDLGTTFSVVGVSVGGKVQIIEDGNHNVIFPSVVSYLENGGIILSTSLMMTNIFAEVLVGFDALSRLKTHPETTIFNSKRFIGRKYICFDWSTPLHLTISWTFRWEEDSTQAYGKAHPYKVIKCNSSVSNYSTVAFDVSAANQAPGSRVVAPEDVGAEVLRYLLKITSSFLGHSQVCILEYKDDMKFKVCSQILVWYTVIALHAFDCVG